MRSVANRLDTMRLNRHLLLAIAAICFHGASEATPGGTNVAPLPATRPADMGINYGGPLATRTHKAAAAFVGLPITEGWFWSSAAVGIALQNSPESAAPASTMLPSLTSPPIDPSTAAQVTMDDQLIYAMAVAGRVALSCDGNFHDHDDINSSGWELAIFAMAGRLSDVVYFGYADHYWMTDSTMEANMVTSSTQAAFDWGYNPSILHNTRADPTGAVNALSAEINKSTATNPLTIIEAGPAELIGRALAQSKATNSGALQYVNVISHSTWNNNHAVQFGPGEGLTDTTYAFRDFGSSGKALGANPIQIPFQQALNNASYSSFAWAQNSPDVKLQHLYARGVAAGKAAFDCSDSGMAYYAMTGVTNANAATYQTFFTGTRINCGGPAYTDTLGQVWSADNSFVGGSTKTYSATQSVSGTPDATLYQSERYAQKLIYNITVPNGSYNVTLSFAEMYFNAAGKRVFSVSLEGQTVLQDLDIWALVGQFAALQRSFNVTVNNGVLTIVGTASINNAQLAAVEVTPGN